MQKSRSAVKPSIGSNATTASSATAAVAQREIIKNGNCAQTFVNFFNNAAAANREQFARFDRTTAVWANCIRNFAGGGGGKKNNLSLFRIEKVADLHIENGGAQHISLPGARSLRVVKRLII